MDGYALNATHAGKRRGITKRLAADGAIAGFSSSLSFSLNADRTPQQRPSLDGYRLLPVDLAMKRCLARASQVLAIIIVGLTALLFLMRSDTVLLRVPPDNNIRPRYYCLLNPFRNKAPENVAETYLNELRDGRSDVISSYIGERQDIPGKENQWPIQSWRVGNREDISDKSEIMYWVKRGNGYATGGYEEEVHFTVVRSGGSWELESFRAIY